MHDENMCEDSQVRAQERSAVTARRKRSNDDIAIGTKNSSMRAQRGTDANKAEIVL